MLEPFNPEGTHKYLQIFTSRYGSTNTSESIPLGWRLVVWNQIQRRKKRVIFSGSAGIAECKEEKLLAPDMEDDGSLFIHEQFLNWLNCSSIGW